MGVGRLACPSISPGGSGGWNGQRGTALCTSRHCCWERLRRARTPSFCTHPAASSPEKQGRFFVLLGSRPDGLPSRLRASRRRSLQLHLSLERLQRTSMLSFRGRDSL